MPATPYAKVLMSINGGSLVSGGQDVPSGATIQLQRESGVDWRSQQWEIYEYPDGFPCPVGWTNVGGVYVNSDPVPPSFAVSASATRWGKYLFRLTVNDGIDDGEYHGPTHERPLVDQKSGVQTVSPNYGLRDVGFREEGQWDPIRLWIGELKRTLRIFDSVVGTVGSGVPGGSNNQVQYKSGAGFGGAAGVEIQSGQLAIGVDLGTVSTTGAIRSRAGAEWTGRDIANSKNVGVIGIADLGASVMEVKVGTYGDGAVAKTANRVGINATEYVYFRINNAVSPFQVAKIGTIYASLTAQNTNFALQGSLASVVQADFGSGSGVFLWGAAAVVPTTNPPANSLQVYVEGNSLKYRRPNGTIVVLDGTGGGGGGSGIGYDATAVTVADWYVSSGGSPSNDGLTSLTPIPFEELQKRIGYGRLNPAVDGSSAAREVRIHLTSGGLATTDPIFFQWQAAEDVAIRIIGAAPTSVLTGTFSAVSAANPATNAKWLVTGTGLGAAHIGKRLRITSGANAGAYAYVISSPGANQVWTSPFSLPLAGDPGNPAERFSYTDVTEFTPAVSDPWQVDDLSPVSIGAIGMIPSAMTSTGSGFQPIISLENIDIRDGNAFGSTFRHVGSNALMIYGCTIRGELDMAGGTAHVSNCCVYRGYDVRAGIVEIYGGIAMHRPANQAGGAGLEIGVNGTGGTVILHKDVHLIGSAIKGDNVFINRAAVWDSINSSVNPGGHAVIAGGAIQGENKGGVVRLTSAHMGGDSARLWGSGNAGHGVHVPKGCEFVADDGVIPTVTGTGGDLLKHEYTLNWGNDDAAETTHPNRPAPIWFGRGSYIVFNADDGDPIAQSGKIRLTPYTTDIIACRARDDSGDRVALSQWAPTSSTNELWLGGGQIAVTPYDRIVIHGQEFVRVLIGGSNEAFKATLNAWDWKATQSMQAQSNKLSVYSEFANVQTTDATVTSIWTATLVDEAVNGVFWEGYAINSTGASRALYHKFREFDLDGGVVTAQTEETIRTREDVAGWDHSIDNAGTTVRVRVTGAAATTVDHAGIASRQVMNHA